MQQWSARSNGQPYAHVHMLKVQSSLDWPHSRSKVRVGRSAHNGYYYNPGRDGMGRDRN